MPNFSNSMPAPERPPTPPGILDILGSEGWARYQQVFSGPGVHCDVSPDFDSDTDDEEGPSAPDTWLDDFIRFPPVNFGLDGVLGPITWNNSTPDEEDMWDFSDWDSEGSAEEVPVLPSIPIQSDGVSSSPVDDSTSQDLPDYASDVEEGIPDDQDPPLSGAELEMMVAHILTQIGQEVL